MPEPSRTAMLPPSVDYVKEVFKSGFHTPCANNFFYKVAAHGVALGRLHRLRTQPVLTTTTTITRGAGCLHTARSRNHRYHHSWSQPARVLTYSPLSQPPPPSLVPRAAGEGESLSPASPCTKYQLAETSSHPIGPGADEGRDEG